MNNIPTPQELLDQIHKNQEEYERLTDKDASNVVSRFFQRASTSHSKDLDISLSLHGFFDSFYLLKLVSKVKLILHEKGYNAQVTTLKKDTDYLRIVCKL